MNIQLLSDLHLESNPHFRARPLPGADLLVLAGDIGSYQNESLLGSLNISDFGLASFSPLPVSQGGLATSGDYERFFEINNRRYCHILHPHTGMPVTHWRSVSVLAPLAAMAGSCTTLAMLKGSDGLAFLQGSGLDFLALDFEGRIHTQAGIAAQAPLTRTAQTV